MRKIDRFSKPVIAVINGFALGGGLELAMSFHFRLMADDPKITVGLTELDLGIIPGWGGTQRLPRLVGQAKALNMILFSERNGAQEALKIGLVDRISAPHELMNDALEFAKQLAERPPIAVTCMLKAFAAGMYEGLDTCLAVEAEGSAIVLRVLRRSWKSANPVLSDADRQRTKIPASQIGGSGEQGGNQEMYETIRFLIKFLILINLMRKLSCRPPG